MPLWAYALVTVGASLTSALVAFLGVLVASRRSSETALAAIQANHDKEQVQWHRDRKHDLFSRFLTDFLTIQSVKTMTMDATQEASEALFRMNGQIAEAEMYCEPQVIAVLNKAYFCCSDVVYAQDHQVWRNAQDRTYDFHVALVDVIKVELGLHERPSEASVRYINEFQPLTGAKEVAFQPYRPNGQGKAFVRR